MPQNYSETDLIRLKKKSDAAIGWTELREVNLGAVIDGARYIGAGGTKVWVTEQGRSSYTVERGDANVPDVFGRLVIVGIAPGQNYVQLFTGAGSSTGNPTSPTPGGTIAHASQHLLTFRWREDPLGGDGVDPAFIGLHQIKDLLVEPETGFTCRVGAGWANVNGTDIYIPSGSFFVVDDSQIPAGAGDALIVRVELDEDEQFQLSYGSDYAEPVTPEAALGNAPAADPTRNTLAYIWLPNGATGIRRNDILPTQPHVRAGGGNSTTAAAVSYTPSSPLTATNVQDALDETAGLLGGGGLTYILIRDEKAQNTQGGTFTSGAWRTRDLNTEVEDTGGNASLSSNQITLDAGTYRVHASCPALAVANHQARLQNITDGTTTLLGTSEFNTAASVVQTRSEIVGRFTIASSKTFELQHQCATTRVTNGFGGVGNFTTEIYAYIELWKEA